MTREEYMDYHETMCARMVKITKEKNHDYAGAGDDPFHNFEQIGHVIPGVNAVAIGFLTRMSDKFSRMGTFVSKGVLKVKNETIEDTILDMANYALLFGGWIKSQREAEAKTSAAVEETGEA